MTARLCLSLIIAFVAATIIGKYYIPWLRKIHAGQRILEDGPTWHKSKEGTPTMGGVIFIASVTIVCLTVGFESMLNGRWGHILILCLSLLFGLIGFLDDWEKLKKKQNLGLKAKQKLVLQIAAAMIFLFIMEKLGHLWPHFYIPFWNVSVELPAWLYYVLAIFIIVGTVNSVNLTDGIDGLATMTTIPICMFFVMVTYLWGENFLELGIFASGLLGGLIGFLVFNYNPAKVFMGDTGSLFLGGAVAALAFAYDMPLILILIGIMYIIEALSDIIQVAHYKRTHTRVFKMAPFHHHLEQGGWSGRKWSEKKICSLYFWITVGMVIISFIGVYGRFK